MPREQSTATEEEKLQAAIREIVDSHSPKKLVVAGPGTGKTTLFGALLAEAGGGTEDNLILTFINALKDDLETSFGDRATVRTLHSHCLGLLYQQGTLRGNLTSGFLCVPGLAHLIKSDWQLLVAGDPPHFVKAMRQMTADDVSFYLARGDYYDAVDYDDAVYRVCIALASGNGTPGDYQRVLVDEYQDFNAMEAAFIGFLAERSAIVIAGDDDQALYSRWRFASWDYIRSLHEGGEYDLFELPYCLRCPEVVVTAVSDVLSEAHRNGNLQGRIDKPYGYFPPYKGADSEKYPKIDVIMTSVQKRVVNYMGRYIDQAISGIPKEEIEEALQKGFPAALVISPKPYRQQIAEYLESAGHHLSMRSKSPDALDRAHGLTLLKDDPSRSVAWRILLELDRPACLQSAITASYERTTPLVKAITDEYREAILQEVTAWESPDELDAESTPPDSLECSIPITVTSFEGAKGLSGQHVFVAGLHDEELPKHPDAVEDLEICKFIVALTRTRKKCCLLHTGRFGQARMTPSTFISWIDRKRLDSTYVDKKYWDSQH